ncbi:GntR family transcriptional regulator [Falsiroseomonas sp.]|uniref:GntR family transcriptional regulator n=1 Tax=Falsiroseomonas sp. TaxID=2870721 RepID=UPI0035651291
MLETALHRPSLVELLVERLQEAILRGELSAGERLREQPLARRFGVSRGPLREAISRLEGRGLVLRVPQQGARIASISSDELEELLLIREALEGTAARLAAARITAGELAQLHAILDYQRRKESAGAMLDYYQEPRDLDFHYCLARASRSRRLMELLHGDLFYLLRVHRYRASQVPGRATRSLDEHAEVLAALEKRDGAAAESLMRAHLAAARESILRAMSGAGQGVSAASTARTKKTIKGKEATHAERAEPRAEGRDAAGRRAADSGRRQRARRKGD